MKEENWKNKALLKIRHKTIPTKCRMCNQMDETVSHLVSACLKLAQKEFKKRQDDVAKVVNYCNLVGNCGFWRADKWYEHVPERVLDNEGHKVL